MSLTFNHDAVPTEAVFGAGAAAGLGAALDALGAGRVLVATTPGGARRHAGLIAAPENRVAAVFDGVAAHCPEPVVAAAVAALRAARADTVVTLGGGSAIGIGKILKAEHGARFVALPTTYSGSEMTPIYGRKIGAEKRTRRDPAAIPDRVIYDPELTFELPPRQTAATGMNSLAHAVEALYPPEPHAEAARLATEAIALHARALPACVADGRDLAARSDALHAGFLGGLLVSMVGVALHHALGHVLGGLFDIDHGDYNAAVLPHVTAFNAPAVPALADAICPALGGDEPGAAIFDFARAIGAPTALAELGMPAGGVAEAARVIVEKAPRNPRAYDLAQMQALIAAAHLGARPVPGGVA